MTALRGEPVSRASSLRPVMLVAGAAIVAVAVWAAFRFDLASIDAHALADQVRSSGALGPALLVLLLIVQSIVSPLPSQPLLLAPGSCG